MSLEQVLTALRGTPDETLARQVDFERLPAHVAIIMDGNGRWAAQRHLPRVEGHRAGIESVRETVADDFHARFSATGKFYEYRIWNSRVVPPFLRLYAWHVIEKLNVDAMNAAAPAIVGEHDFAAFRSARSLNHTTVRTITRAEWRRDGDLLVFEIAGTGFLRYMVRSLVGTMVEVGRGQRPASDMADLLAKPDRSAAGRTAPPHGLFLVTVSY